MRNISRYFNRYFNRLDPISRPYIFDHIFKTAGTTFHTSYMAFAFRDHERFVIGGIPEQNNKDIERLKSLSEKEKRKYKIIAGHQAGQLRPWYPQSKYITLMREPVSRIVSAYLHAKFHDEMRAMIDDAVNKENIDIVEFVEDDFLVKRIARPGASLQNYQYQVLCGLPPTGADGALCERDLETAINRYHLIGLTEEFHLFLFLLHLRDNFPLVLFNNRLVRRERAIFTLSQREKEAIVRYNRRDIALYKLITKRFHETRIRLWHPRVDALWHTYMGALKDFQRQTNYDEKKGELYSPPALSG